MITRLKRRYEKTGRVIGGNANKDRLSIALFRDTITPPDSGYLIERIWPVHSTFSFILDDYKLQAENLKVNSIKLMPSIASTEAGPEHIVGTILKRSFS